MPTRFHFDRFRSGALFVVALILVAAIVSWLGIREGLARRSAPIGSATATVVPVGGPIALPIVDIDPPEQANRDVFMVNCVICHSARLPLGQPDLSEKQWTEVVHKMVAAYGAPISKEDESKIVVYLRAVQTNRGNE